MLKAEKQVFGRRGGFLKRAFDAAAACVLAAVLLPVMLITAATVLVAMGRPILFRQTRIGRAEMPFTIIKFRSMIAASSKGETADNARLTGLGRWLRATSLDELPELWNVIRGDMSLVGPRPLLPQYLPFYTAHEARRHAVRPGLTGWAQVNGRNALSWEQKFEHDVWYVDNQSFALDLKILWRTMWIILRRDGINSEGHATMPPFQRAQIRHE
jgi:sugar transferase EpsL